MGMVGAGASADYWLRGATNSMRELSYANPHGAGIAGFRGDAPVTFRTVRAAHRSDRYAEQDWLTESPTLLAHDRFATVGTPTIANTHPFRVANAHFAHNGSIADIAALERELGPDAVARLQGTTDSERWGALIAKNIDRESGDVHAGVQRSVEWLADASPLTSANFVLATPSDLYALRWPDARELHWTTHGVRDAADGRALLTPADMPATVVSTEPLDDVHTWTPIEPGQLLHVRASDQHASITQVIDRQPTVRLPDTWRADDAATAGGTQIA